MVSFEEIYRRHYNDVLRFIYSKVHDYNDALDLTSEVFLKALKGFSKLRKLSAVKTWLFSIANNAVKDYWSYRNRHFPLLTPHDDIDDLENPLLSYDDNEEEEEDTPDFMVPPKKFKRAYDSLKKEYKDILYLFYVERMTYGEIAESLGIPIGTVKSRLNRAKRRLKYLLEGRNETR
ncbi:MAG: RNA polymerase sigma factor [Thermotogae bacterium]|nr:RNA polymerase sigma factor [Thermotogota bacterium]